MTFNHGGYNSLLFLQATSLSLSRTLTDLKQWRLQQSLPYKLLQELQEIKSTVRLLLGAEAPRTTLRITNSQLDCLH